MCDSLLFEGSEIEALRMKGQEQVTWFEFGEKAIRHQPRMQP